MFESIKNYGNLAESVVNRIIQGINSGELKPGDKLPSERDMGDMFSVSRTVIRDALKTLVGLGVVNIRHGTGAFINVVNQQEDVNHLTSLLQIKQGTLKELFQVREIIESQSVVWCTQNATSKDINELEDIVRRAKEQGDESRLALLDAEFHLKISEAAGNRVLVRLMINLLDLLGENRIRVIKIPGRQRLSVLDHEAIVEAIKNRNLELARACMLKHLADVNNAISTVNLSEEDWLSDTNSEGAADHHDNQG